MLKDTDSQRRDMLKSLADLDSAVLRLRAHLHKLGSEFKGLMETKAEISRTGAVAKDI